MGRVITYLLGYLNPIKRLGKKRYSVLFPLLTTIIVAMLIQGYAYGIAHDPNAAGLPAIFIPIALIIYFSFRDGIQGGLITTTITVLYYLYIIKSYHYTGKQEATSIDTTLVLGSLYVLIAAVIGGLKQKIDKLIEQEANEKRRLQAIVQQLPIGVMIADGRGTITQTNRELEKILGARIPVGGSVSDARYVGTKRNGKIMRTNRGPLATVLATKHDIVGREYVIERSDGRERMVRVSATVIRNTSGKVIAGVSLIRDVTEEKEMETRKDDFVNMASHELKTPITSMKLYVDLLGKQIGGYKDEKMTKTLKSIRNQTLRLQDLVNDLLDVSRLQTGKLTFTKEEFRLDSLIEEACDDLRQTSKPTIILKRHPRVMVFADRVRIYQVISNLITNATKYSPGTEKIIVSLKREKDQVVVSVQDFGIGIAKADQAKVFDRLYQVGEAETKTFPGFGMGLYISKEIITRHKGRIWVDSMKDKGSTFSFSLPLEK
jgi:signal transduction histidine kinase